PRSVAARAAIEPDTPASVPGMAEDGGLDRPRPLAPGEAAWFVPVTTGVAISAALAALPADGVLSKVCANCWCKCSNFADRALTSASARARSSGGRLDRMA